MHRKLIGGAALFLVVTIGSAPRSAPAQSSFYYDDPDGFASFSVQEQEWENDMGTTDCSGECPGRGSGCCPAAALPL